MAAPITHIALTDKVFNKYFKDKDKPLFCVGTVFPDIRYLAEIEREKTHLRISSLAEVEKEKNSFLAGVKFHDFVDCNRFKFYDPKKEMFLNLLIKNDILPKDFTRTDLIKLNRVGKLIEDELVYDKVKSWSEYIGYLDEVYKGEIGFGVSASCVKHWHRSLQDYFRQTPNPKSRTRFFSELGWSKGRISKIERVLEEMKNSQELLILLASFYSQFESFIGK